MGEIYMSNYSNQTTALMEWDGYACSEMRLVKSLHRVHRENVGKL